MRSRLLLATVGLVALTTAAEAADLPSRRAPPVFVPPPVPVFTWTGFYIGGNAGYAFKGYSNNGFLANDATATALQTTLGLTPAFTRSNGSGFTGGGQIGYNFQIGGFSLLGPSTGLLVGAEADAAYIDNRSTALSNGDFAGGFATSTTASTSRLDYLGTVRGRLGLTFDRFLVYGTGGFAYGGARGATVITFGAAGAGTGYAGAYSKTLTGYTYGGGVEYALPTASFLNVFNSSAVTLKAEYLHYNLGSATYTASGTGGFAGVTSYTIHSRVGGDLVRGGLNFKFGDVVPAPVVARY